MIEVVHLSKHFGSHRAVDDLSFEVRPGRVTGFLGPNGAGKSTTMRMILGIDAPTQGSATIRGRRFRDLAFPLREVGAMLDARAFQGGRRARDHMLAFARSNGLPARRVDEVLDMAGLTDVGKRRVGSFSLGMCQRLGIAVALLGDPDVVILDEPVNGLDTDGIRWIRELLRTLAGEGRTVLLSSHLMSEMELTADHLIVIGRGQLLADVPLQAFIEQNSRLVTTVLSPQAADLAVALEARGVAVASLAEERLLVESVEPSLIGEVAARCGIALHELTPRRPCLEDVYVELTQKSAEFRGALISSEPWPR